ncbi:MAG: hypothetical protein LBC30_04410 [Puniceicoccales bacterium]|jgi:hypothetical protein|nr:hypothetical protein [Puniceicoccales bacterium]
MTRLSAVIILLVLASISGMEAGESKEPINWCNEKLEWEMGVKYATERVSNGCKSCGKAVFPHLGLGYKILEDVKLFVAMDTIAALKEKYARVAPCLGILYTMADAFTIDTGYTHYFYTFASGDGQKHSNEIYGGIGVNIFLSPSLYAFYDFDNKDFSLKGKVVYEIDLGERLMQGLGVEVSGDVGYETAKKSNGQWIEGEQRDFFFYGAGVDLVYTINKEAKAKIGGAWGGNSAKTHTWVNDTHRNFIWINASVECSF